MNTIYFIQKSQPVIESLKKLKEVAGIAFYGSVGRGAADRHSDVDIVCFVKKVPDRKARRVLWNKLGATILPNTNIIDTFEYKNTHFGIWYKPIDEMDKSVTTLIDKKTSEWLEGDINNFVAKSEIVLDPTGCQRKWKKKVEKYPNFIKTKKFEYLNACQTRLESILNGLRRQNHIYVEESIWFITNTLISILYSINNEYFSTTKLVFEDAKKFKTLPKNCIMRIHEIGNLDNRRDLLKKIKLLKSLLFDIMDIAVKQKKDLRTKRSKEWCDNIVGEIEALLKKS